MVTLFLCLGSVPAFAQSYTTIGTKYLCERPASGASGRIGIIRKKTRVASPSNFKVIKVSTERKRLSIKIKELKAQYERAQGKKKRALKSKMASSKKVRTSLTSQEAKKCAQPLPPPPPPAPLQATPTRLPLLLRGVEPVPTPGPNWPSAPANLDTVLGPMDLWLDNYRANFYVVSDGPSTFANLQIVPSDPSKPFHATVRVFRPNEELLYWSQFENGQSGAAITEIQSGFEEGVPSSSFRLPEAGVYQIRIATETNARVTLRLPQGTRYGYSAGNTFLKSTSGLPRIMYTFLPYHPTRSIRMTFGGDNGAAVQFAKLDGTSRGSSPIILPPNASLDGEVHRVTFPSGYWTLQLYGSPLILSPDVASAEAIRGSIEHIDGGTLNGYLVNHKFQKEIARLIPKLLAHVGNADEILSRVPSNYGYGVEACRNPANDDDVIKFLDILTHYSGTLPAARWALMRNQNSGLPNQIVDPASPWAGSIGTSFFARQICEVNADCVNGSICVSESGGKFCAQPFSPGQDRWDVQRISGYSSHAPYVGNIAPFGGLGVRGNTPLSLIFSALTSTPCNGFGPLNTDGPVRTPELFYRGVLAALVDLMVMEESEVLRGNGAETGMYTGYSGFISGQLEHTYHLAGPSLERIMTEADGDRTLGESVRAVWTKALRRFVDATYNDNFATTRNQPSHHIFGYEAFQQGLGDLEIRSSYRNLSRRWAQRFFESARDAGYFEEIFGPSPSYIGITHSSIAEYYRMTERDPGGADTKAIQALSRSYEFFNHTVATEPDGRPLSGFNFGHRIGTGFELEQYTGARFQVDEIPQVGVWTRQGLANYVSNARNWLRGATTVQDDVARSMGQGDSIISWVPRYFYGTQLHPENANLKFPSEADASFIKNFSNELIAVKMPGYYTNIYVGHPIEDPFYLQGRTSFRHPTVGEDLAPEVGTSIDLYKYTPFLGGGLSLVSSPGYGAAVLSTNWSAVARNGIMAVTAQGRQWEDYMAGSFNLDIPGRTLIVEGEIENTPLHYERRYQFLDNRIDVRVTLTSSGSFSPNSLTEVIPIPTCSRADCTNNAKNRGAFIANASGGVLQNGAVNQFQVRNSDGGRVSFVLDQSRNVTVSQHGLRHTTDTRELQIGRVEVALPQNFTAGSSTVLSYSIVP